MIRSWLGPLRKNAAMRMAMDAAGQRSVVELSGPEDKLTAPFSYFLI
jgi:hypothetical protein